MPTAERTPPTSRGSRIPSRADARRNYDRLVNAARDAFAESGIDASLDEIAHRAGVGNATLYRHFPTRYALLEAVHRDQIETICRLSEQLAEEADPDALEAWLRSVVDATSVSRGLAATVTAATNAGETREAGLNGCREAIFTAGDRLLDRAKRLGSAPQKISIEQLLRLVNAITATAAAAKGPDQDARLLLGIVMAGLRSQASTTVA